jgi:alpha-D-xyloside xylohydrolase
VRHYGEAEGTFSLYDDDGLTFDYESGAFSRTVLEVARDAGGNLRGSVRRSEGNRPWGYGAVTFRMMSER